MLREGRFGESWNSSAAEYTDSSEDDLRLFSAVVNINIAHVRMLAEQEIITFDDAEKIVQTLKDLRKEGFEALDLRPELEDIHMALEEHVNEKVGKEVGGKLHTAKSRNDQVSAAIRMVLREEIFGIQKLLIELIEGLSDLAEDNIETIMPGYTHLQVAEPVTFGHYLCSYSELLTRDLDRFDETFEKVNQCPMGACALAGTSFDIDRELTKSLLGFDSIIENTIDAVGSRDFALQCLSNLAILMDNLSRFMEELILWNTAEFDMVDIPDEFATTSSIMPQKKNAEVTELGRAKAGTSLGNLIGGLSIMKSLPQAYNLDLQELTPLLWDSVDQVKSTLDVTRKLVGGLKPKPENMKKNAKKGFSTMTEVANTLVRETEIPFRKAHKIVGRLASRAMEEEKSLDDITVEDLYESSEDIVGEKIDVSEDKFNEALEIGSCVESRDSVGGPSPEAVDNELNCIRETLKNHHLTIEERMDSIEKAEDRLMDQVKGD